jgi:hypothetical protein
MIFDILVKKTEVTCGRAMHITADTPEEAADKLQVHLEEASRADLDEAVPGPVIVWDLPVTKMEWAVKEIEVNPPLES